MNVPVEIILTMASVIFCIGAVGVVVRRDPIIMFICIEMMFNAANLVLVALSNHFKDLNGQAMVFLIIAVAAAEVGVGLSIVIAIFRSETDVDVDRIADLRG